MSFTLSQFLPRGGDSFVIKRSSVYHALNDFHSHPELELIHVTEGIGTLIIGEKVIPLTGGELILIGCNVPHMFKFQQGYFVDLILRRGEKAANLDMMLLHFDPLIFGEHFIKAPENESLKVLARKAEAGLVIEGEQKEDVLKAMETLAGASATERLIYLLLLFNKIAQAQLQPIADQNTSSELNRTDETRLSKIFLITINEFHKRITLKDIADAVYMAPNAFCNYFKLKTGRTYFDFLLEVRIKHACKLLRTTDFSVLDICYYSGYTNLSNFNRQFKDFAGATPLEYRKNYKTYF
ncbi:MAG: helix-turn-helix domain-containing protein [Mucilaginibacter sp.]|nr:helix-turn-helix domain-containing protein [Mucilaginibacter sp.]